MSGENLFNSCAKGPVPYCLDELSTRPNARSQLQELQTAIEGLRADDFRGLENVFGEYLFAPASFAADKGAQAVSMLNRHWFDEKSAEAYFPSLQPIAPIYAQGVLKTLELSLSGRPAPVPIDAWWIMGYDGFELINLYNNRQVTLLIATPAPPKIIRKLLGDRTEVWTTGRGIVTRRL